MNIEKKIFYCWFGGSEKPTDFLAYLETWKKHMPDYEIFEINETNFDISEYPYAKSAYDAKKYAFVSDCARIHYLQKYGGIYLDTDVEMKKSLTPLISKINSKIIFSMEYFQYEITGVNTAVIISEKNCKIWSDLLKYYITNDFVLTNEPKTINMYISELLDTKTTFKYRDKEQNVLYDEEQITIIPSTYLMRDTNDAYCVHHLAGSWTKDLSLSRKIRRLIGVVLKKIIGRSNFERLWNKK